MKFSLIVYICMTAGFADGGITCHQVIREAPVEQETCYAMQSVYTQTARDYNSRFNSIRSICLPVFTVE